VGSGPLPKKNAKGTDLRGDGGGELGHSAVEVLVAGARWEEARGEGLVREHLAELLAAQFSRLGAVRTRLPAYSCVHVAGEHMCPQDEGWCGGSPP